MRRDITVAHAREALQRAEGLDVGTATSADLCHELGWVTAALRTLLTLVDEEGGDG